MLFTGFEETACAEALEEGAVEALVAVAAGSHLDAARARALRALGRLLRNRQAAGAMLAGGSYKVCVHVCGRGQPPYRGAVCQGNTHTRTPCAARSPSSAS